MIRKSGPSMLVVFLCAGIASAAGKHHKSSMVTVEGAVVSFEILPGESDLPLVAVTLDGAGGSAPAAPILLAPKSVLEEIGFRIEKGDRLRAKIFVDEKGPAVAHKVMNMSRGTMVRLRTLHRVPIWNSLGRWEGGPMRHRGGGGGGRLGGGPP